MLEPESSQSIVIKTKLLLKTNSDEPKFIRTMEQYCQACNRVSQFIFDNDFPMNQLKIRKAIYRELREIFGLKSMMAQSAIQMTIARYKTVKEQLRQNPYKFQDQYTGKWHTVSKDLQWLRKPISFHRPQVDLVRNRDWSKLADGTLSINTLDGRVLAKPVCHGFDQYFDGTMNLKMVTLSTLSALTEAFDSLRQPTMNGANASSFLGRKSCVNVCSSRQLVNACKRSTHGQQSDF